MAQIRFTAAIVAAALVFLLAFTTCFSQCRKAQPEDVPHGANELIELGKQKLTRIAGTVFFPHLSDDAPANDIVVELYRHSGKPQSPATVQPPRLDACVTGHDGKFSFPGIKPGKYVLRIGPRASIGVNEMLVPIVVKRFGCPGKRSTLKLRLALGT